MANEGDGHVVRIDAATNRVTQRISLGRVYRIVAAESSLWVTSPDKDVRRWYAGDNNLIRLEPVNERFWPGFRPEERPALWQGGLLESGSPRLGVWRGSTLPRMRSTIRSRRMTSRGRPPQVPEPCGSYTNMRSSTVRQKACRVCC